MSNSIVVKGNVTKTDDLKFLPSGGAILSFGLADNTGYGDKKLVTFWRVTVFGKQAEALAPYVVKGGELSIIGEASSRPWKDKEGVEKVSMEIRAMDVWLGKKPEGAKAPEPKKEAKPQAADDGFGGFDDVDF